MRAATSMLRRFEAPRNICSSAWLYWYCAWLYSRLAVLVPSLEEPLKRLPSGTGDQFLFDFWQSKKSWLKMKLHLGTLLFLFCVTVYALEEEAESRVGKRNHSNFLLFHNITFNFFLFSLLVLPIFQVVRFPNDVCTGTTRNGTCFTA